MDKTRITNANKQHARRSAGAGEFWRKGNRMKFPTYEDKDGTNLAEVGTDCISRQAAIDYCEALMEAERVQQTDDWGYGRERYNQTEVIQQYLEDMPPAQSETAKRIIGKSKDGMTLWYQCDMCNEPVDAQDNFCRECGRRLIDE